MTDLLFLLMYYDIVRCLEQRVGYLAVFVGFKLDPTVHLDMKS